MLNRGVITKVVELLIKKNKTKISSERKKKRKPRNWQKPRPTPDNKTLLKQKGAGNRC